MSKKKQRYIEYQEDMESILTKLENAPTRKAGVGGVIPSFSKKSKIFSSSMALVAVAMFGLLAVSGAALGVVAATDPAFFSSGNHDEHHHKPHPDHNETHPPHAPHPQHTNAPHPQHTNAPHPQQTNAPHPQQTNSPHPQHHTNAPHPQHHTNAPHPSNDPLAFYPLLADARVLKFPYGPNSVTIKILGKDSGNFTLNMLEFDLEGFGSLVIRFGLCFELVQDIADCPVDGENFLLSVEFNYARMDVLAVSDTNVVVRISEPGSPSKIESIPLNGRRLLEGAAAVLASRVEAAIRGERNVDSEVFDRLQKRVKLSDSHDKTRALTQLNGPGPNSYLFYITTMGCTSFVDPVALRATATVINSKGEVVAERHVCPLRLGRGKYLLGIPLQGGDQYNKNQFFTNYCAFITRSRAGLCQGLFWSGTLAGTLANVCDRIDSDAISVACIKATETLQNGMCAFFDDKAVHAQTDEDFCNAIAHYSQTSGDFVATVDDTVEVTVASSLQNQPKVIASAVADGNGMENIDIQFQEEPEISFVSTDPTDPDPGQGYVASATYTCDDDVTSATISVVGTDGFTRTRTCSDGMCTLPVPGASANVEDTITVNLVFPGGTATASTFIVF